VSREKEYLKDIEEFRKIVARMINRHFEDVKDILEYIKEKHPAEYSYWVKPIVRSMVKKLEEVV